MLMSVYVMLYNMSDIALLKPISSCVEILVKR